MRADQFVVQNNVKLKFVSEGIEYTMNLAIENGLITLDSRLGKQIIFLGERETPQETEAKKLIETKKKQKKRKN